MTKTNQPEAATPSLVERQFGPRADAYLRSAVHAGGEDLALIATTLAGLRPASVLDLGCGGGHVSFAAAAHAGLVTAFDLSAGMLATVAAEAARRGLSNLRTERGVAEKLPFADASFDVVVTRYSAHHWSDARQGVLEAARVLRPGGTAILADIVAAPDAQFDTFLQTFEMLRDPSHIRDYSVAEWRMMVAAGGLEADPEAMFRLPLDFTSWVVRMATPPAFVTAIRDLQALMPERVRAAFEIAADGSFVLDSMVLIAHKQAL